jgi:PAS domain-containing protein
MADDGAAGPVLHAVPDDLAAVLEQLETANEELRVAEEELADQRRRVHELLAGHDAAVRARDTVFALLPLGVVVTDSLGVVRQANVAAADLLGIPLLRLPGKPLVSAVAADDRRRFRDLLADLVGGVPEVRADLVLSPRDREPQPVEALGLADEGGLLRWVLLPRDGAEAAPVHDDLLTATALARLAALPVGDDDRQRMLGQLSAAVRGALPAATAVSIVLGDPAEPEQLATDSAEAQRLDGLQYRLGEGPCVEAYRRGTVVVTADVATDPRWPRLAGHARAAGMRGVLAVPVRLADRRAGVVNVYASGPTPLPLRSLEVGEMVAATVAAVLQGATERAALQSLVHHLERALDSRALIEQAKGVVIARHGGTADEAFARIARWSTNNNVKLREVARRLVDAGDTAVLPRF